MVGEGSPMAGRLIFLIGARRSGTNWLQRILTAHPAIAGIPSETYLFSHGLSPLVERFQHASPGLARTGFIHMDRTRLIEAVRAFCDRVFEDALRAADPAADRLVERTPWHARHLDLIGEVYPDAQVVHIIRDPHEVCGSLLAQDWGPNTMTEAAEEWRDTIAEARRDAPARYHEVRYEELLADPARHTQRLFEALGVQASRDVVEAALSAAGVRFNVDPSRPEVAAGKWRQELTEQQLKELDAVAGELMRELGYSPAPAPAHPPAELWRSIHRIRERGAKVRRWGGFAARIRAWRSSRRGRADIRRAEHAQELVDEFLGNLHTGNLDAALEMLGDGAAVTVSGPDGRWSADGSGALSRLRESLSADSAFRGSPVRGDVHPSLPTFFVVSTYRLPDGAEAERALALTISGDRITGLALYASPPR